MPVVICSRRAVPVVTLLLLAALVLALPRGAHAETLSLDPAAASECPDCATLQGGAQVINYFEQLAPRTTSR
ncbi:hypothetical protein DSM104299_00258 [Baekduia alba]|uniref:hypothetical protein n=1 Tax=Baekduia alba TaxID=2997333 RepID=UPI0023405CF7|nr:hypothetical protein [Baekduia alba]WCB91587.1 hypothetical protein DSM104299_00258 [Baekduia alba]